MSFWKCATCLKWNHETTCYKCGKDNKMEMCKVCCVGNGTYGQGMPSVYKGA